MSKKSNSPFPSMSAATLLGPNLVNYTSPHLITECEQGEQNPSYSHVEDATKRREADIIRVIQWPTVTILPACFNIVGSYKKANL